MGEKVRAIALAGGKGVRARPLTLASPDYLRSKATIRLAGRTLIEWSVAALRDQGVEDVFVVANGSENRAQIKAVLGDGDRYGVSIRYSRTRFDRYNTGSGEATLRCLEHWRLDGLALVFPVDSIFHFDLADMVRAHRAAVATVTVATVRRPPAEVAGKYGVLVTDERGLVRAFAEKPDLATAQRLADGGELATNAGMYLVDCGRLRLLAGSPALKGMAADRLDWGGDLLPYLAESGDRVLPYPIDRFGDLGSPRDYLDTLRDVLRDGYPWPGGGAEPVAGLPEGVRIHPSSLQLRDEVSGRTLADKLRDGTVRIGPNVRIGSDVEIGPGAVLADSDIADGVDIGARCRLRGVACGEYSIIGPGARLSNVFLGSAVEVRSRLSHPVVLEDFCAIGDEVRVHEGVRLRGVSVFPRIDVWSFARIPPGACLVDAGDVIRWS